MANWALVEDNKIKELHDLLPKNWKSISGLNLSADNLDFLKSLGWLKVVEQYQEYDNNVYQPDGYEHEIVDDLVIQKLKLVEKTKEEVNLEELKNDVIAQIRIKRNELLQKSDWTQLLDVQNVLSSEEKAEINLYRQKLRDLPNEYMQMEVYSFGNVIWPDIPFAITRG